MPFLIRQEETLEEAPDQRFLTKRHTQEAVRFIEDHESDQFSLYLPRQPRGQERSARGPALMSVAQFGAERTYEEDENAWTAAACRRLPFRSARQRKGAAGALEARSRSGPGDASPVGDGLPHCASAWETAPHIALQRGRRPPEFSASRSEGEPYLGMVVDERRGPPDGVRSSPISAARTLKTGDQSYSNGYSALNQSMSLMTRARQMSPWLLVPFEGS